CRPDIICPMLPPRVVKIPATIAAAEQVDLKHGVAHAREAGRLQRRHPPRLVHLFGERVYVYNCPRSGAAWRVIDAEALSRVYREKKRVEHERRRLAGQLSLDEAGQAAKRLERGRIDFVI